MWLCSNGGRGFPVCAEMRSMISGLNVTIDAALASSRN
jgi:hypothetical protein